MKSTLFVLVIALVAALSGCGMKKDAEVKSFIAEMDQVAIDIVRAVDEKPESGIDRAQQILDTRKTKLKAQFETLKQLRGYELSEETTKQFTDAVTKNAGAIAGLQVKYAEKSMSDEKFAEKLDKLSADFNSIFGV